MNDSTHSTPEDPHDGTTPTAVPPAPGSHGSAYSIGPGQQALLERQLNVLRDKARNLDRALASATANNSKLVAVLETAKSEIQKLRSALERDGEPPYSFGTIVALNRATPTSGASTAVTSESIDVYASGRKMRVGMSPLLRMNELSVGQEVLLNEAFTVIAALGCTDVGELVTVKELLGTDRALVIGRSDDERVLRLAGTLHGAVRVGDALTMDARTGYALEKIPRSEVENLILEEVPDISYADIGGLASQIEQIRDAVELPFLHPDLYREHGLKAPKGILLYGPPGCGKTLIAKAVANSLAKRARERSGVKDQKSYFLNIKGPELLDKYVGETERQIRLIFSRAREKASDGSAVVVFFDEMDSLFRTRGTGVSSDVETTIVPQLLSEIDGVERLDNVIVIGASNREDMIDPAILRPGRLDVKVKIQRPDAESAADIFTKYVTTSLPFHADDVSANHGSLQETVDAMVQRTVEAMYATDKGNEFLEVTYANGDTEMLYFKDFNSGAVIQNVVDRAKKYAIKDLLTSGEKGIRIEHMLRAVVDEFREHEDMPNTTNPDDWARISGKKGERITYIRTIVQSKEGQVPGRTLETLPNTGQYL
ncbi:proteasome ATPase [Arthrobacter psychrochitiniphilus]|uniref:AAA ATPase forming ring-shaped complexes n=1 Tax=Arthrobacter psychrochitiniphilus TaxID=291045 RepID=A0A2V3DP48_9MICC|nr:proteasome ATPase [Arthrobacter psychrochitiniphilus]NYG17059.1 proteasome-associated ATPase [Arthrobacter psychrochitiniphilus]PXA64730.1 proteasome ATPase [Arthrobacter psychrochitiniphilus]